jgi:hypothetical protein
MNLMRQPFHDVIIQEVKVLSLPLYQLILTFKIELSMLCVPRFASKYLYLNITVAMAILRDVMLNLTLAMDIL